MGIFLQGYQLTRTFLPSRERKCSFFNFEPITLLLSVGFIICTFSSSIILSLPGVRRALFSAKKLRRTHMMTGMHRYELYFRKLGFVMNWWHKVLIFHSQIRIQRVAFFCSIKIIRICNFGICVLITQAGRRRGSRRARLCTYASKSRQSDPQSITRNDFFRPPNINCRVHNYQQYCISSTCQHSFVICSYAYQLPFTAESDKNYFQLVLSSHPVGGVLPPETNVLPPAGGPSTPPSGEEYLLCNCCSSILSRFACQAHDAHRLLLFSLPCVALCVHRTSWDQRLKTLFCVPTDELLQAKDDFLSEGGQSLYWWLNRLISLIVMSD